MRIRSSFRLSNPDSLALSSPRRTRPRQRLRDSVGVVKASTAQRILTKEDLIGYLASGCKTRDKFRIGTEHEKLGYNLSDNSRLDYSTIEQLLTSLHKRFGWDPILEKGKIIGLKMDGQSVTLEPGGQLELSGAPLKTLHQTCGEVNSHLYQVKTISEQLGVGFVGIGHDPKWSLDRIYVMPKERYDLMRSYMPTRAKEGLQMMLRTCTIQVNLDFESELDMIQKFRIGLALQPIAIALFANSPFTEGKANGYQSWRSYGWLDTDPDRCGNLPFVFESNFGFERYVDYALDVPMYFIYRPDKGGYVNALGLSFKDFMEGRCPALPGEYPTMEDWEDHLTTIFPDVRLKRYLEMRGADGGPWKIICALPALWVGLLYDDQALSSASDLISDWTQEDRDYLQKKVPRLGLKTPFKGGTVLDVARETLKIARGGLERRGYDEVSFLKALEDIAETGLTQADILLNKFNGEWNQKVDPFYDECHY